MLTSQERADYEKMEELKEALNELAQEYGDFGTRTAPKAEALERIVAKAKKYDEMMANKNTSIDNVWSDE